MQMCRCLAIVLLSLVFAVGCTSHQAQHVMLTPMATSTPPRVSSSSASPTLPAQVPTYRDHVSAALMMRIARAAHSATLLPDGHVLIAGGFRTEGTREIAIASAELYDPATDSFQRISDMTEARSGHTATLLPSGEVLIVGWWGPRQRIATAELYNPQTRTFRATASLAAPRASMTATLLADGHVVIIGGDSAPNVSQLVAEIYDPATETFTQGQRLSVGRSAHTATLLQDGTVLIVGGSAGNDRVLASAEIYDPRTGGFTPTGDMHEVRYKHAAVLLPTGNVLIVGGSNQNDWTGKYLSAEEYDPATRMFHQAASLIGERFKLADGVALLRNGNVLVASGNPQIEIYDSSKQRFLPSTRLDTAYYYTVLTVLQDGRVLLTGGYDSAIHPTTKAWIYS